VEHFDLFSGIGGFALAAQSAGFKTIGFSEVNKYCCRLLRHHFPEIENYGDIKKLDGHKFSGIDLLTAGFPCQPFSVAGKRRGGGDPRDLWPQTARIIGECRPRYALLENVAGLLSMDRGRYFRGVLGSLAEFGYDAIWNVLPASSVGAPHLRKRLWIVAYSNDGRLGKPYCYRVEKENRKKRESNKGKTIQESFSNSLERSSFLPDATRTKQQADIRGGYSENNGSVESQYRGRYLLPGKESWTCEPGIHRVVDGIPGIVARNKGYGNAIVPQCAYIFLKAIAERIKSGTS